MALSVTSNGAGKLSRRSLGQLSRQPAARINAQQTLFVHPTDIQKSTLLVRREAKGKPF